MPQDKKKPGIGPSTAPELEYKFINYHGPDFPESNREKLIKSTARKFGRTVSDDNVYFEQYLHPDKDIIPRQDLRPSRNPTGTSDTQDYRKLAFDSYTRDGKRIDVPNVEGLGNSTIDLSHPDYDSVYDVWDFNTDSILTKAFENSNMGVGRLIPSMMEWGARKVLNNIGKPYTVYDRFPKNTQPIGLDNTMKGKDIHLPKESIGIGPTGSKKVKK